MAWIHGPTEPQRHPRTEDPAAPAEENIDDLSPEQIAEAREYAIDDTKRNLSHLDPTALANRIAHLFLIVPFCLDIGYLHLAIEKAASALFECHHRAPHSVAHRRSLQAALDMQWPQKLLQLVHEQRAEGQDPLEEPFQMLVAIVNDWDGPPMQSMHDQSWA